MRSRRPNPRLVKINRNYTVEEIAKLLGIHKNTVRTWLKHGLPTCDDRRPVLILGWELKAFLESRRLKSKRPCTMGELYCLRCRMPQKPAGGMVDFEQVTAKVANLMALCPCCELLMNRRISIAKLMLFQQEMNITFTQPLERLGDSDRPTVNSDFK